MINKLNKIIGLIFFVSGLYLILRNNQDLPFYSLSLITIMFIFSFVLVFLPILNSNLIQKELGWSPKLTFEEGLKKTIYWYINNLEWCYSIMEKSSYTGFRIGDKKRFNKKQKEV